jgi:hypothetical protein
MTILRILAAALPILLGSAASGADLSVAPAAAVVVAAGPCADARALDRIVERFAWAEQHTWRRGFVISSIANPRPSGHPWYEPGIVKRAYCIADSVMTNGVMHTVYYAIEYGMGFASIGDYVDFCVLGLDPWRVHDGACRTVR